MAAETFYLGPWGNAAKMKLVTAGGVLAAGSLSKWFHSDYSAIGAACALVYALGILAIHWAPDTTEKAL